MANANSITIRRFQDKDKQAVIDLINQIMGMEFSEDQAAYPTGDIETIEKSYGQLGEAFFVATNGDTVVGTVAIKKEDNRTALLRRLFVSPEYRKRKIGVQLIDRALKFCNEVGYQELIFKTTSKMQGAIKLCEKKGFVRRAQLNLGNLELFKFSLALRGI